MRRGGGWVRLRQRIRAMDGCLWLALVLAAVAALPVLAGPGLFNTRAGGDSPFLLLRTQQMAAALRAGEFPVRWMPDANYGLGYPAFSYYAALPYYLAASLALAGCGILWGVRLTQALAFVLAGGATYALLRRMGRGPRVALVGSALYIFAPFHLINVYVRGDSLSEFAAMALVPAVLWALAPCLQEVSDPPAGPLRADPQPRPKTDTLSPAGGIGRLALAATFYAALVLCHNITALVASPFLALWLLCLAPWRSRVARWRFLAAGAAALVLGLVLSAGFWLPALGEQHLVQLGDQTTGYFHYAGHLRGFGAARPLVQWRLVHDYAIAEGRDPFSMGGVQAALALVGLAAAGWRVCRRRADGSDLFYVLLLLSSTLLTTPLSRPLWGHLPMLPYVQFPWRWLALQALAVAWLGARCIELIPPDWVRPLCLAACGLAVAAGLGGLRPDYLPLREGDLTARNLQLYEAYSGNIGGTVRYEYLPAEMVPRPYTSAALLGRGDCPLALAGTLADCMALPANGTERAWRLRVEGEALLALPVTWFPGWRAMVDDHVEPVEPLPGLGLIGLRLMAGEHTIALRLGRTPLRLGAEIASAAGAVLALGMLAWAAWRDYHWRSGGIVAISMVAVSLVWVAGLAPEVIPVEAGGSLWMDTERAPLLHPEPEGVRLGTAILRDYTLGAREVAPGATLPVTLHWEGDWNGLEVRLVLVGLTAHLFDHAPIWQQVQAPIDGPAQRLELPIPLDAPPGLYAIRVRAFQGGKDQALRSIEGLKLAKLALEPITVAIAPRATGEEARLASYGPSGEAPVASLVAVAVEQTSRRSAEVRLTWRSERQAARNYQLSLRLTRPDGSLVCMQDLPPMLGGYPMALWQPGELLGDRVVLEWEAEEALTPAHTLSVVLYDLSTLQAIGEARLPAQ